MNTNNENNRIDGLQDATIGHRACVVAGGLNTIRNTGAGLNKTAAALSCAKKRARKARHGQARRGQKSGAYRSWCAMKQRCTNPNHRAWKHYGGQGVTVCERWMSFENFFADMGQRPEGFSIDRIDPYDDYKPANCRWADAATQAANTCRVREKRFRIYAAWKEGVPVSRWQDFMLLYSAVGELCREHEWRLMNWCEENEHGERLINRLRIEKIGSRQVHEFPPCKNTLKAYRMAYDSITKGVLQ